MQGVAGSTPSTLGESRCNEAESLSSTPKKKKNPSLSHLRKGFFVAPSGVEPLTRGFSVRCSTN